MPPPPGNPSRASERPAGPGPPSGPATSTITLRDLASGRETAIAVENLAKASLVMGPGGYRFGDYWRLGLPLSIIVATVATALIPVFWPLG